MIPKELLNELPNAQGHYGEIRTVGGSRYIRVDSAEMWVLLKEERMKILKFEIGGPWWTDSTLEFVVDSETEVPVRGSYSCASDPSARFDFKVVDVPNQYLLKDVKGGTDNKAFVSSDLSTISYWHAPEACWYEGDLFEK